MILLASKPLVSAVLVNYRTERFLAACLESLRTQDYPEIEIVLVDNASPDFDANDFDRFKIDRLILNDDNIGFARANNLGITEAKAEFILLLNCDAYLDTTALTEAMNVIMSDTRIGQIGFKVLNAINRDVIDTTGHLFRPDRTAAHRGHAERDNGAYNEEVDMFGASACISLYRRAMLNDIAVNAEYFDPDFGSYYEDVDLDWRARIAGWRCRYAPRARAYHHGHGSGMHARARVQIEAEKNRYLMMLKCDTPGDRDGHRFEIALYECWHLLKLLRRPVLFAGLVRYVSNRARALERRKLVQAKRSGDIQIVYTPRFSIAARELSKPPPRIADFNLALQQPPTRRSVSGFQPFLDDAVHIERYVRIRKTGLIPQRVSVLILNINGAEMTRECLCGLLNQTYPEFEVIVLDNGSTIDELAILEHEFPTIKGVRYPENTGFSGGINRAYELSKGSLIALINNDCVPEADWLENLVLRMKETDSQAVSGTMSEELKLAPTPNHALNLFGRIIPGGYGDDKISFYPSGGNCIIDRFALESMADNMPWILGRSNGKIMSDFYLLYSEDVSLGWRMRLSGMQISKSTKSLANHRVSATAAKFPAGLIKYFRHRNRLLNLLLFPETKTLIKLFPLLFLEWVALRMVGLFYWQLGEPLLSVDWFFLTNMRAILRQRRIFQKARVCRDEEITSELTLKIFNDSQSKSARLVNMISRFYCAITRINVHGK